jgi:hypothetical protein
VAGFDGAGLAAGEAENLFTDFFAYEGGLRNGIYVGVGDVNGDGLGDLICGGGPGGGPRVRVVDAAGLMAGGGGGSLDDMAGAEIANYFAGSADSRDGVRVGTMVAEDGTVRVVALDVATNDITVFDTDGEATGELPVATDDSAGFFACSVRGGSSGDSAADDDSSTSGDSSSDDSGESSADDSSDDAATDDSADDDSAAIGGTATDEGTNRRRNRRGR